MTHKQVHLLFLVSIFGIIVTYSLFFKKITTIGVIIDEIPYIGILIIITIASLLYKRKLKGYPIIDFQKENSMSLKNLVLFFLVFQVIDYIYEDGFRGMISMWLSYWVLGYIAFFILNIMSYYKNFKLIESGYYNDK